MSALGNGSRSSREIRTSLNQTKTRIERDFGELSERVEENLTPRGLIKRYPALLAVAGAALGFLVVRRPALLVRAVGRIAQAGLPLIVSRLLPNLLQRGAPTDPAPTEEPTSDSSAG